MVSVITPPQPLLTPADIPGDHDANDPLVAAMIAAATGEFDGPYGSLKRAIGKQTLEIRGNFCGGLVRLPLPPIIGIVGVFALGANGVEVEVSPDLYRWADDQVTFVSRQRASRIRYLAGFSEVDGTGPVPPQVRVAIIMAVKQMKSLADVNLFLRSEQVEDVGGFTYSVNDQAAGIIKDICGRLLSGLRMPRV